MDNKYKLNFEWKYGDFNFRDSLSDIEDNNLYEPLTYNYFLEAHTIKLIEDYFATETKNEQRRKELYELMLYDTNIEIFIDNVRGLISSINNIEAIDRNDNFSNENIENLIVSLQNLKENIDDDYDRYYIRNENALLEFCENFNIDISKINIKHDIYNKITYIDKNTLEKLLKILISNIENNYTKKYNILSDIKKTFLNFDKQSHYDKDDIFQIAFIIFSNKDYDKYILNFIQNVKDKIITFLNSIALNSISNRQKFSDILNSCSPIEQSKLWNRRYAIGKTGCFATLHIKRNSNGKFINESYFSLSGAKDYNDHDRFNIDVKKYNEIRDLANTLNECFFNKKYIYAQLSNLCKAYTWPIFDKNDIIKFRPNGFIQLADDYKIYDSGNASALGFTYGCCERKLIANIDKYKTIDDIKKTFYIKYVPCEKCQQAILDEKGEKEIYAVYNDSYEMKMLDKKYALKPKKLSVKERYVLNRC